jgi:hypothetical protein
MYDSSVRPSRPFDWAQIVRTVAGAALLGVGIILAIWLAIVLYGLIWSDVVPAAVAHLTPQSNEDVAVIFPGGEVVLAHKVFPVIGYIASLLFLIVGVWLIKVLISGGASLLQAESASKPTAERGAEPADIEAEPEGSWR